MTFQYLLCMWRNRDLVSRLRCIIFPEKSIVSSKISGFEGEVKDLNTCANLEFPRLISDKLCKSPFSYYVQTFPSHPSQGLT